MEFDYANDFWVLNILIIFVSNLQMRRWEAWEEETRTMEYQVANGTYVVRTTIATN